jgi:hypothetical protein
MDAARTPFRFLSESEFAELDAHQKCTYLAAAIKEIQQRDDGVMPADAATDGRPAA